MSRFGDAMQWLFCRHADCGKPYESTAGHKPPICPSCEKVAAWATQPGTSIIPAPVDGWTLTYGDRNFLKSIRIAAES